MTCDGKTNRRTYNVRAKTGQFILIMVRRVSTEKRRVSTETSPKHGNIYHLVNLAT